MPRVSVIIPVYNDAERLKLCLDRLAEQTFPRDEMEVIVVDNGSTSPPRELVESYPFCQFAEESAPGSYAARNRGLSLAAGDIVAFTDADCLPHRDWLEQGVAGAEQFAGPVLIGGAINVVPNDPTRVSAVEWFDVVFGLQQETNVAHYSFAATANAFANRDLLNTIGHFNSQLLSGGDTDWGKRAAAEGYPVVYHPGAAVDHPARRSLGQIATQARRHAGGRITKGSGSPARRSFRRRIINSGKLLLPPMALFRRAASQLRSRGVGWPTILQVCGIVMIKRYILLWEGTRVAHGAKAERR